MNSRTEKLTLYGAAGAIEALRDAPAEGVAPQGTAVIAHPHPLFGGTMDNKVVQTLARAFVATGWTTLRFNFRGVGASAGTHDEGSGECEDFLAVVEQAAPQGTLALAGFSFGAFVTTNALARLWPAREIGQIVLVGTAAARFSVPPVPAEAHERTLVVHGDADQVVPIEASGIAAAALVKGSTLKIYPGAPHGLTDTHKDQLNADLLAFLKG